MLICSGNAETNIIFEALYDRSFLQRIVRVVRIFAKYLLRVSSSQPFENFSLRMTRSDEEGSFSNKFRDVTKIFSPFGAVERT